MTTEQLPPSTSDAGEHQWGAPQNRPPQRWSTRKTVVSAAVAVAVVAAGGAAIYAASGSTGSSSGTQGGPGGQMMQGGPRGGQFGLAGSLHGEYVVSDGNGGYTTELTQTGTVTELSATELTARSADGYTKTYTIGSAGVSGIANGDTVTVTATASGNTATLERVSEATSAQRNNQNQGQS
ncbi:hypothetical protein HFP15_29000 [Amycolatopsis sp. K13G38]|uniref:DUF5666 domain-containing protein n=1 Tax=Amycolatopsis acididurans TaxID=2724524 RepID=A0ABX1JFA5_9PSEU|nr:hypothetical protein [Amycolatopsis acididurans]NKQ56917.1 hypothetical protein [Amycolatopsis acididurans]